MSKRRKKKVKRYIEYREIELGNWWFSPELRKLFMLAIVEGFRK